MGILEILLFLSTTCYIACQEDSSDSKFKGNLWDKFAASHFFGPSFLIIAVLLTASSLFIARILFGRNDSNSDLQMADEPLASAAATAAPPWPTAGGLDESKIDSCTELVVLSESSVNQGTDSNTCPICLESYHYDTLEVVRSIAKCGHCFHADCIGLWLRKNRTCPVCRTILSDCDL